MASYAFENRKGSVWERFTYAGKDWAQIREEMEEMAVSEVPEYPDVHWESGAVGGIGGKWVIPEKDSGYVLYYIHGGGFTAGSSGIPLRFLMELSHRLGLKAFSADYRMAPECVFPASTDDAFAGYAGLLEAGYDADQIIVCGESAGGSLSLGIPFAAAEQEKPFPRGIIAMSPVTDALSEEEDNEVVRGLASSMEVFRIYAPGQDLSNPLISPALGDLSNFPPVLLFAGGAEELMPQSLEFAQKAAAAGCDVRLHIGKDMIHTYPLDFWDYPEAMTAFEEIELFIRQLFHM